MNHLAFRFSPLMLLAFLTVLAWGTFAVAAAVLGRVHLLALVTAVLTTGLLVGLPFLTAAPQGAAAPAMHVACRDCGQPSRGESWGFCLRCGSVRVVPTRFA